MKHLRRLFVLLSAAPFALVACGGGGSQGGSPSSSANTSAGADSGGSPAEATADGTGTGTGTVSVVWPARGRAIPTAANSILVKLTSGNSTVAQQLIVRPSTGATFTNLPYGSLGVSVAAYPNADGTGVAQATGTGTMAVTIGIPGAASVSLASAVAYLAISPSAPTIGKGTAGTLTVSAHDASGNIVPLSTGGGTESISWTCDAPAIASISGTGPTATATGLAVGSTTVHASFAANGAGATVSTSTGLSVVAGSGTVTVQ